MMNWAEAKKAAFITNTVLLNMKAPYPHTMSVNMQLCSLRSKNHQGTRRQGHRESAFGFGFDAWRRFNEHLDKFDEAREHIENSFLQHPPRVRDFKDSGTRREEWLDRFREKHERIGEVMREVEKMEIFIRMCPSEVEKEFCKQVYLLNWCHSTKSRLQTRRER